MPTSRGSTRPPKAKTAKPTPTPAPTTGDKGREATQALASEALDVLATIMRGASSDTAKIAACNALLDRGLGKARARTGEPAEGPAETRVTVRFV